MRPLLVAAAIAMGLFGLFFVLTTDDTWLAGGLLGGAALLGFVAARP